LYCKHVKVHIYSLAGVNTTVKIMRYSLFSYFDSEVAFYYNKCNVEMLSLVKWNVIIRREKYLNININTECIAARCRSYSCSGRRLIHDPSSPIATLIASRYLLGLTFPDFDLATKRNEKLGYCRLDSV